MPITDVQFPPNNTGGKVRTFQFPDGRDALYRVFSHDRAVLCTTGVSTFRTVGAGQNNTNPYQLVLFTLTNGSPGGIDLTNKLVAVRRLTLMTDVTIAQTSVMGTFEAWLTDEAVSGGTVLEGSVFDTDDLESGLIVARGACSADGGALSEPSVDLSTGVLLWQQFSHRMQTAVTESRSEDNAMIPAAAGKTPIILTPSQSLVVRYSGPNNGWRNTSHGIVKCVYEEFYPEPIMADPGDPPPGG
jgi:hypothetical protein